MEKRLRKCLPEGEFAGVTSRRSAAMRAVRSRGNRTTEQRLRFALVGEGIRGWSVQPRDIDGLPDFFFAQAQLAVFVDGCFWHGCSKCGHVPKTNSRFWKAKIEGNTKRDRKVSRQLRAAGIRVIRLWEHELASDLHNCITRITAEIKKDT